MVVIQPRALPGSAEDVDETFQASRFNATFVKRTSGSLLATGGAILMIQSTRYNVGDPHASKLWNVFTFLAPAAIAFGTCILLSPQYARKALHACVCWLPVFRFVHAAWNCTNHLDCVYERNNKLGAAAMSNHFLRMSVFNSMGLVATAMLGAASMMPWLPQLVTRGICVVSSWAVVRGMHQHHSAQSWSAGQSDVTVRSVSIAGLRDH
jgi:hypothetical protein